MFATVFRRQAYTAIRNCCAIPSLQSSTFNSNKSNVKAPNEQDSIKSTQIKTPKFALRKQKLPPYPEIEEVRDLKLETFLSSNFKQVKYGDYTFTECLEGYVHVYATSYRMDYKLDAPAGYSVFFGDSHPLNEWGRAPRRQALNHAKLYSVLQTVKAIPENLFEKVCICVDDIGLVSFVVFSLKKISENSFRSTYSGKLNKDLETSMELNKVLRTRQDLQIRLKYVPNDIGVHGMYRAGKLAVLGSEMELKS